MDWTAPVDIYCERLGPGFWAEPLNALSNAAFLLAALWAARVARARGNRDVAVRLLVFLAFCIGVGSFLFHTVATAWAGVADVLPIWLFVLCYAVIATARIGGLTLWQAGLSVLGAIAVMALAAMALSPEGDAPSRFNGSEQYFPALALMIVITAAALYRRSPVAGWFAAATLTFAASLALRTFDMALCPVWPYGTHVFWHLLNGTVIALLLQALIRTTTRTEHP